MKKFLIAGLGNIGENYQNTRHNIGFSVLDSIAKKEDLSFRNERLSDLCNYRFKGKSAIFIKPTTYMNLSGKAIKYWLEKEKIPIENLLIITDDLNLPFGTLRLKKKGSSGGHNGLKNIQEKLNTTHYNRLRFGIGRSFSKGKQIDYVLDSWEKEESESLPERYEKIHQLINAFLTTGVDFAMNLFNGK